ncbi:helix-turn-helix domain-containing protein [Acetobacter cerevisiae]|uniref:CI repressor n=2 Tax=Acetobacter TaxID=434 RepID=A0A149V6U1_9PROT|nr:MULTISPECIES: helix-turn-helix domain-containing protein [Acetobacter]KXV75894.1 hypothetical protein AD953_05950 [Acetobacter malorum]MCP1245998.1 helix-turn-helix domain-containing protein [Acetobacter cerevisiae]MCP1255716.1 helix-turn-helix domain-containing protein [Acetobacter cerevisiae]
MKDAVLTEIMMLRGLNKAISEACGLSTAAVSQWRRVPKKHVEKVSVVTGRSAAELRPDLFPNPENIEEAA